MTTLCSSLDNVYIFIKPNINGSYIPHGRLIKDSVSVNLVVTIHTVTMDTVWLPFTWMLPWIRKINHCYGCMTDTKI